MKFEITPEQVDDLQREATSELDAITTQDILEHWRTSYLGRNGKITGILRSLGGLSEGQQKVLGQQANKTKLALEMRFAQKERELKDIHIANLSSENHFDVTMPGRQISQGRFHPTTRIIKEICGSFIAMGFQVLEGPEIEWDKYNFEMLNIPKGHPARDMWNSLWIEGGDNEERKMLLRTHTSPMQARIMEHTEPPIRVLIPGKCYRYEATDATHEWHFYQVEGLAVDEGITFANLKGTLYEFARKMFGADRKIRFRCDYFPFVEPGVDMSIDCFSCVGQGCRICQNTGWIEIMGAGMVHPKVLEGVGYDSTKYTGFAFGMGPERIAMLRYGIDDIRLFYSNDLRFLRQF